MRFELFMEDDAWHWRLVDDAGTVFARSRNKGYRYQHAAIEAIQHVKSGAAGAYVEY